MTIVEFQEQSASHLAASDITELLSFRLARFVAINDRNGQDWTMSYFGLRLNEWRVLGLINAARPIKFRDISERLLMDKGQLSRIVKSLAGRGYITSYVAQGDARSIELSITETGRELHGRMFPFAKSRNNVVVEVLSDREHLEFTRILEKLATHNENLQKQNGQFR